MTQAVQEVLSDSSLKGYVSYYAHKIARRFPNFMDKKDAEQDLWEAIFKALPRYDGRKPIGAYARAAVFSKYGHLIDKRLKKLKWYEYVYHYDKCENPVDLTYTDRCFETVEANITLDNIEKFLEEEAKTRKQYTVALNWFKLMRKGYSPQESAETLSVTVEYLWNIRSRIFRKVVRDLSFV